MKRKTLDLLFSIGGVVIAGLLLVAGLVLSANASFATTYVAEQLGQQNIVFKTAGTLTDEEKKARLQRQLADLSAARETVFKGETLRGLLLTTYGFSEFGTKAGQAAMVAYFAAALMLLLSIAGFVHAARTPVTETFAAPQPDHQR